MYAVSARRLTARKRAETADTAEGMEADARIRTADPFITSEVLYQLSYVGGEGQSSPAYGSIVTRVPIGV
jgi:hypothetical protein